MRFVGIVLLALLAACVERKLHIRTEPEGAMVKVNGREIGPSPVTWTFTQYGKVRVAAYLDGYLPEQRVVHLKTPWYEYPFVDFFSDIVVPAKIKDDHDVTIQLAPRPERTSEEDKAFAAEMGARAVALRTQLRELEAQDQLEEQSELEKSGKAPPKRAKGEPVDFD